MLPYCPLVVNCETVIFGCRWTQPAYIALRSNAGEIDADGEGFGGAKTLTADQQG